MKNWNPAFSVVCFAELFNAVAGTEGLRALIYRLQGNRAVCSSFHPIRLWYTVSWKFIHILHHFTHVLAFRIEHKNISCRVLKNHIQTCFFYVRRSVQIRFVNALKECIITNNKHSHMMHCKYSTLSYCNPYIHCCISCKSSIDTQLAIVLPIC